MLRIKNEVDVAKIYISGNIVDDADGSWQEYMYDGDSRGYEFPSKIRQQLDLIQDRPLEVHINSYGGSVFAGIAISNFIREHKAKTTCIVDGVAGSIAGQIFFSGDVCKMPANCYLVLHKPLTEIAGNADDLRAAITTLDIIQNGLETLYMSKAKPTLTVDKLHSMINAETWLTGKDAAEQFEIEVLEPARVLNCADLRKHRGVPAVFNQSIMIAEALEKAREF